ncbi:hypothetical protein BSKO_10331 [Bryopsis sp. KO-2023]|nr:hypothetical protein BSKO_10331 [Bryopsis sp. KO-2023]
MSLWLIGGVLVGFLLAFSWTSPALGFCIAIACVGLALYWLTLEDGSNLKTWPKTSAIYAQALTGAFVKKKWVPDNVTDLPSDEIRLQVPITFDGKNLAEYRKVMHMSRPYKQIPLMYFIVEPFGMSMLHMVRSLPITVLGLVLARNESECFRPVELDEPLTHSVKFSEKFRRTAKEDVEFDLIMAATDSNGFVVWRSSTTVIVLNPKRLKAAKNKKKEQPKLEPIQGEVIDTWKLEGDTGRKYAALNGDINPIHLHPFTSKLFGFRKPIAHALYKVGRCVAALENKKGMDVVGAWKLNTEFKRPTMLPCKLKLLDQSKGCEKGTLKFCLATEDGLKEVITGTLVDNSKK